jgi:hypothetical protein
MKRTNQSVLPALLLINRFFQSFHQANAPFFFCLISSSLKSNTMKKYILSTILLMALLLGLATGMQSAPSVSADQPTVKMENRQTATATVTQEMGVVSLEAEKPTVGGFLVENWGVLSLSLLSFLEVITRLTPSEKDNTVLSFVSKLLNVIIPNFKKGGGRL